MELVRWRPRRHLPMVQDDILTVTVPKTEVAKGRKMDIEAN